MDLDELFVHGHVEGRREAAKRMSEACMHQRSVCIMCEQKILITQVMSMLHVIVETDIRFVYLVIIIVSIG